MVCVFLQGPADGAVKSWDVPGEGKCVVGVEDGSMHYYRHDPSRPGSLIHVPGIKPIVEKADFTLSRQVVPGGSWLKIVGNEKTARG